MIHILFVVAVLLLSSCKSEPHMQPFGEFPQPVRVAEVGIQDTPLYLEVMGSIDAPLTVELRAQVVGRLKAMHVAQGGQVKRGDLLFTVDPAPFQAILDQAKAEAQKNAAQLRFAKAKLARYRPLAEKDYVPQLHYDQYQNEVEALTAQALIDQAAVECAKINLGYCSICAPMDGKISESRVDPGNLVCPNDAIPLTVLRQLNPIEVRFHLPQKEFQKLQGQAEQSVEVLLPGESQPHCAGKVYFIDNHLSLQTGTILCKASLPNVDHALWPGEYVRVRLATSQVSNARLIPFSAVQLGQAGSYVYVVKPDQTVEMRPVHVAERRDGQAILIDGLEAGERVVIDGQLNLHPGSKVDIKP